MLVPDRDRANEVAQGSAPLQQGSGRQPAPEHEHPEAVNHSGSKQTHLADTTGTSTGTKGRERLMLNLALRLQSCKSNTHPSVYNLL